MPCISTLLDQTALANAAKLYSSMNLECPECHSRSHNIFAFSPEVRKFQIPVTVCTACNTDIKHFEDQPIFLGSHEKIMELEDQRYAESMKLMRHGKKKKTTAKDRKHDSDLIQKLIREL